MASSPSLPPGLAQDWEACWVAAKTAWDIGGPYKPLASLIAAGGVPPGPALVPGCGRGYDVASLAAPERPAVGLDLAPTAVAEARRCLALLAPEKLPYLRIEAADFFAYEGEGFASVFDYTMLCATLPSRRHEWASKMKALLRAGGLLLCGGFPLKPYPPGSEEDLARGPPFQLSKQLYHDLLEPLGFVCVSEEDVAPEESAPIRAGFECFSVWRAPGPG